LRQAALELPAAPGPGKGHLRPAVEAAVEDARERQVDGCGQGPLGQPGLVHDLQGPRLQRGGPGLVVRRGLALDHPGRHPVAREFDGGEQARRPGADHQYVGPPGTHDNPLEQGRHARAAPPGRAY
jgi:hypothetical protein